MKVSISLGSSPLLDEALVDLLLGMRFLLRAPLYLFSNLSPEKLCTDEIVKTGKKPITPPILLQKLEKKWKNGWELGCGHYLFVVVTHTHNLFDQMFLWISEMGFYSIFWIHRHGNWWELKSELKSEKLILVCVCARAHFGCARSRVVGVINLGFQTRVGYPVHF